MLDADTRRRIDSLRDILVGKVPDPKSQVEQITIALIYKFMDDMDAQAEALGGKRSFFVNGFERFSWPKLLAPQMGGQDTINLYGEAIGQMTQNTHLPPLFRDIFKNAYLPYRDPETLRSFLKEIDAFRYDHSEKLGDAFEYLLSVLGSQGDAGQFRTPRHLIDFIVSVVNPQKHERLLDPACGTAGFLISAWKHILAQNGKARPGDQLTAKERDKLASSLVGYDISPDMVRLSLVNLYLHGFPNPRVDEYDTLTSDDRWNEHFDVILANPPFMSPKGGIKPHKRFSIQAKRSEVLFVDYIAEHLTPTGRAGIIVPEGIIFQSQTAYKALRKMLVNQSLVAVISLPAGCFNPYSGVKTSILILDKSLAKQADSVAFFKIENDGYGLGAQRRAVANSDLPQVKKELDEYLSALRQRRSVSELLPTCGLIVTKEKLAANGEFNLSGERYRENAVSTTKYRLVPVGEFMKGGVKTVDPRSTPDELFELWSIPAFDAGSPELLRGSDIGSQKKVVAPSDVLLSRIIPHIRRGWVVRPNSDGRRQIASTEWIVFSSDDVEPEFLRQLIVSDFFHASFMQTITGVGGSLARANPTAVGEIKVPLPPLEVQKEIVAEIEGYQKVIDGARAVVDNYRPHIPIHPDWPIIQLSEICSFKNGLNFDKGLSGHEVKIIGVSDFQANLYAPLGDLDAVHLSEPLEEAYLVKCGDILFVRSNGNPDLVGRSMIVPPPLEPTTFSGFTIRGRITDMRALPLFYAYFFKSRDFAEMIKTVGQGANIRNLSQGILNDLKIPLPPLATQQAIVAEIEAEQALVNANRELITRFEQKIQATLARAWGESPLIAS